MERKLFKKIGLTLAMAFVFSIASYAQLAGSNAADDANSKPATHKAMRGHEMDPDKMLAHLDKQLNLTDDQKTKIKTILTNSQQHAQSLRSDTSNKSDRREQMKQLHEDMQAQIRAALNPDQQKKFDEMRSRQEARMQNRHKKGNTSTTTNPQ